MYPYPFQAPKDKNSAIQSPKQLSDILNALDKAPIPNPTMVKIFLVPQINSMCLADQSLVTLHQS